MKTVDSVIDGLRILREYDEECHVAARSDMVWGPKVHSERMSDEDLDKLEYGGWFQHPDGNWCIYCL